MDISVFYSPPPRAKYTRNCWANSLHSPLMEEEKNASLKKQIAIISGKS